MMKSWCHEKISRLAGLRSFRNEFMRFNRMSLAASRPVADWSERYPCLTDRTAATTFDRHYLYHLSWAARKLAERKPALHIDVGSSLYFCSLVSAFVPVRFYDYRKAELNLSGLDSRQGDLNRLPLQDRSAESVSCMHVIEHVGLGRYGDPLDPEGDLKAIRELKRVVAPAGTLLIVVPVGRPRILFNAHRIYSYPEMMKNFEEFELKEFALIPDHATDGDLLVNPDPGMVDRQDYACGCFQFVRASQ